ncbi:MAG: nucS [Moraxellaceae bacterium]|jgi:restriction system protein|nr:nucS [Moraxellaceae bacterium]
MKSYRRIMLGRKSVHAPACFAGGFIGIDFGLYEDLSQQLPENWRDFNHEFIPRVMAAGHSHTKIGAGLACGFTWTLCKGIQIGDIVLSPDGTGGYRVGEVTGNYFYAEGEILPHRRAVHWRDKTIQRADMSEALKRSTGSIGTISDITGYAAEVETLIVGTAASGPQLSVNDETIEDAASFALEKHLEDFLVLNWAQTELGKDYDIFTEDGETVGQQYPSDTGPMDILAISKDKKTLLVVELKKGRASDNVVGQVQRYMGFALQELAEPGQTVKGVIIALEDDQRIRRALAVAPNIAFYRYQISFKLLKA